MYIYIHICNVDNIMHFYFRALSETESEKATLLAKLKILSLELQSERGKIQSLNHSLSTYV